LMFPVKIKFLSDFFSEQEIKSSKEKLAITDLYMILNFGNITKKNPQSVEPIEDLNCMLCCLSF